MAMSVDQLGSFERREEAKLALAGYRRLYETQLRAERKSPKTIEVYRYVLEPFERWFQGEHRRPPVLRVRLVLVAGQEVFRKYLTFFRPDPANPRFDEVFLSPNGYPLTEKGLEMVFARARHWTGIRRLHAHLLRHTYGIRAQEGGMPTIPLQHYMGHTSSKVTERYAPAAQSEKLKRARGVSPVDQLGVRIKPTSRRNNFRRTR